MIEGLKLDFSGEELREHLSKKCLHHKERADFYQKQADALVAGNAETMQYTGGDPVKALRDKAITHQQRCDMFKLLHDHTSAGETYRLEDKDLTRLELISQGWY
jgi:hypothetical protein